MCKYLHGPFQLLILDGVIQHLHGKNKKRKKLSMVHFNIIPIHLK